MALTKLKRLSAFVFAVIFFAGCANSAHIEKDPSANLGNYKTYSWIEDGKNDANKNHKNDLVEANIRKSVNQELQKSGFTETKNNPDLLLTSDVLVENSEKRQNSPVYTQPYSRVFFNRFTGRFGTIYYPSQFLGYDSYTEPVQQGTVTITMVDPKTDKTIWQGWATDEINSRNITGKEIQRNVKSIFRKFDVASK
jgi:hypothetical protein